MEKEITVDEVDAFHEFLMGNTSLIPDRFVFEA